jgi:hypothetical protein
MADIEELVAEYQARVAREDLTRWADADNTQGTTVKYDVTAFLYSDGRWVDPSPIAGTLRFEKVSRDISARDLTVTKFRYAWHDGHLNWRQSETFEAPEGRYYPTVGVAWYPAAVTKDSLPLEEVAAPVASRLLLKTKK